MNFSRLILSLSILVSACGACAPQAGGEGNIDDVFKEEPGQPGPDPGDGTSWRSKLYPADWTPGYADAQGRFLHDFSYAGYHSGLRDIPVSGLRVTDVTKAPYNADPTGTADATAAIQAAIDALGAQGGGVVYLPAGTYKLSLQSGNNVLTINKPNVVLRGAGPDKTFLLNTTTSMRSKSIIGMSKSASWDTPRSVEVPLTEDVLKPSVTLPVQSPSTFSKGDLVVVMSNVTEAFCQDYKIGADWSGMVGDHSRGPHFFREVTAVSATSITLDAPTRYRLLKRDNARVYKVADPLTECGIEHLAIGNVQNPRTNGWGEEDYGTSGNGAYEVHASHAIKLGNTMNCWVLDVKTFRPAGNDETIHLLSNGIVVNDSRFVTIKDCDIERSQYEGGGGNGYMYTLGGNDCLVVDCHAEHGRHNYDFKGMKANGNVILRCSSTTPSLASDFHMHLSMANLIDGFVADKDHFEASFRPYGSAGVRHMYSATECVFWNTKGLSADKTGVCVISLQPGYGYVIGTSGACSGVKSTPVAGTISGTAYETAPEDWVEGVGKGETLTPKSLYEDQLKKRKARQ